MMRVADEVNKDIIYAEVRRAACSRRMRMLLYRIMVMFVHVSIWKTDRYTEDEVLNLIDIYYRDRASKAIDSQMFSFMMQTKLQREAKRMGV